MNAEQKQQAKQLIADWTNVSRTSTPAVWFLNGDCMAGFLQELIDAPEPEPVAHAILLPNGATRIWFSDRDSGELWRAREGVEQELTPLYTAPPANNQSDQHLEMVRDAERYRWLRDNMAFDYSADGRHAMKLARPLPAPWHNFNTDWIAHLFMPCVDKTVDAAIAAEKGGAA